MPLEGFGDEASDIKKRDEFVAAVRSSTISPLTTRGSPVTDDRRKGEDLGESRRPGREVMVCESIR